MIANTIFLVEDEANTREMLHSSLSKSGFQIREAESAEDAMHQLDGPLPNIFVIDWLLPGISGIDLVRRLRRNTHTARLPIIMLTTRGEEFDRLQSFESSVDDYIVKPFSPQELVARVRAVLRRSETPEEDVLELGPIRMNLIAHQVFVDGAVMKLGPTEFRLLELFLSHPNKAFSRAQLISRIWDAAGCVEERTVDVHMLRLRKALKPFGAHTIVQTVRSVGYRASLHR